eukprot:scaffold235329_cov19-Tisochrysis_lutea.AAC.1
MGSPQPALLPPPSRSTTGGMWLANSECWRWSWAEDTHMHVRTHPKVTLYTSGCNSGDAWLANNECERWIWGRDHMTGVHNPMRHFNKLRFCKCATSIDERFMISAAGQQGEGSHASADALSLDVGRILKGPVPAGAVGCIAALVRGDESGSPFWSLTSVRRCKDLQAALVAASEELAEARRAEQGLRQQNAGVIELSQSSNSVIVMS